VSGIPSASYEQLKILPNHQYSTTMLWNVCHTPFLHEWVAAVLIIGSFVKVQPTLDKGCLLQKYCCLNISRKEFHISRSIARSSWQFFWPMVALSALLLGVVLVASLMVRQSEQQAKSAFSSALASNQAFLELEKTTRELRHQLALYAATGDESYRSQADSLQKQNGSHLIVIQKWVLNDVEKGLVGKLLQYSEVLQTGMNDMKPDSAPSDRQKTAGKLVKDVMDSQMLDAIHDQCEHKKRELLQIENLQKESHAGWWLLILGILGAIAGLLAGYSLALRYQREMTELSVPIRNAAGSLSAIVGPINVSTSLGTGGLETTLNGLAEQITTVVNRLQSAERENVRKDQMAALGQLAAGLAHELRNPLTAIKTLIEAARDVNHKSVLEERDLEVIDEEISRLNKTLQAFLDYARPPKFEKSSVDLNVIAQKVQQLLSAQAEQRAIQIVLKLPQQPVLIEGDGEQLRQVLLNLILNAFDAMGTHGTVTVEVDHSPGKAILQVKDTGPGISDSIRNRIFEPFASAKPTGTGLGLTVSRRIVEEHGGTIAAENMPAGGACFTITLPT